MKRIGFVLISFLMAAALFAVGTSGSSAGSGTGSTLAAAPSAMDLYNQGYAASNAGKYQEAAGFFQKAIAAKSDYAEAYNMLGYCTRKMGDVAKAFTYYDKALQLKPNFPEAREYYGEAYLQQGNLTKAVQQYIILEKSDAKVAQELLDKISDFVNQNS